MTILRVAMVTGALLLLTGARSMAAGPVNGCSKNCDAGHTACLQSATTDEQRATCDAVQAQCEERCTRITAPQAPPQ